MMEQHRRGLLRQLAALPLIGGAVTSQARYAQAADDALLEKAARLDKAEPLFRQARELACLAARAFLDDYPPFPPAVHGVHRPSSRFHEDVLFRAATMSALPGRCLHFTRIILRDEPRRSAKRRKARKALRTCLAFKEAVKAVEDRHGFSAANDALHFSRLAIETIAADVFALSASTMLGIAAKARTIVSFDRSLDPTYRPYRTAAWSFQLAQELDALLAGGAASAEASQ